MNKIRDPVFLILLLCFPTVSSASGCYSFSGGSWRRVEASLKSPTHWKFTQPLPSFESSGSIQCSGDCNRSSGTPIAWERHCFTVSQENPTISADNCGRDGKEGIKIVFDTGASLDLYCDMVGPSLFLKNSKNENVFFFILEK